MALGAIAHDFRSTFLASNVPAACQRKTTDGQSHLVTGVIADDGAFADRVHVHFSGAGKKVMPIIRRFRGKRVKRTTRKGDKILVLFQPAEKGFAGERILVPITQYLAERESMFVASKMSLARLGAKGHII